MKAIGEIIGIFLIIFIFFILFFAVTAILPARNLSVVALILIFYAILLFLVIIIVAIGIYEEEKKIRVPYWFGVGVIEVV